MFSSPARSKCFDKRSNIIKENIPYYALLVSSLCLNSSEEILTNIIHDILDIPEELRNKAEQYINSIDASLAEKGDSIDENQKNETIKLRDELKTALQNNDIETLRTKIGDLERAAEFMAQQQANGQNPYANSGSYSSNDNNSSSSNNDDNIMDADFTDKNN